MNELIFNFKNRLELLFRIEKINFFKLLLFFLSFSLFITTWWLPRNWGFYGNHDWDLTYSTFEVVRKSIVDYGQFPHHNPYFSFGSDLWSNPQSVQFNILLLPVLLLGTIYGLKLGILIYVIWSCFGAYKWFCSLKINPFNSLMLTFTLVSCSYFARHIFEAGHSNFVYLYGLPWLFFWLCSYQNSNNFKFLSYVILYLTLTLIGGAPLMYVIMLLFVYIFILSFNKVKIVSLSLILLSVLIFPLMLGYFKLYPVLSNWNHFPRLVFDDSFISLTTFFQALGDYSTDTRTPHQWHEHSLGFPIIFLGLILFFIKKSKVNLIFVSCLLLIFWLSIGNFPNKFNLWYFANHYLPVFNGIRSPYRFGIILVFFLYYILAKSLKDEKEVWISYFLMLVAFSQILSHSAISKFNIKSPRIEDLSASIIKSDSLKLVHMNKEKAFQFLLLKNNYLISNAYEPMVLSPIKDTLNSLVKGGDITYFSPNLIKIYSKSDTVQTCFRYSDKMKNNYNTIKDNRMVFFGKNNQSIELNFKYKPPFFSIILSVFGLIFLVLVSKFLK